MKRILYLFSFIVLNISAFAQEEEGQGSKIRERMTEYIQQRLNLSRPEADRFGPVFLSYFNELRKTNQDFKGDRLVLQQKVAELRLNYRNQFKGIMGEKRSNDVFTYEHDFIDEVKKLRLERLQNDNGRRNKKGGLLQ